MSNNTTTHDHERVQALLDNDGYDESGELCPALLVEYADEQTAPAVEALLVELLADETVPEEMRRDVRARLADLARRFGSND